MTLTQSIGGMQVTHRRCQWKDFVRFINDDQFWTRWTFYLGPDVADGEKYFIEAWSAARGGQTLPFFDFDKTNVTLIAQNGHQNMALDGEPIHRHFEAWFTNPRV